MGPHVVLICADQWRADCLGVEGHPDVETPTLDHLAAQGVRCERAYSATPTCVPARMTMLTGLTATSHGRVGYQDGVRFDVTPTIASLFGQAGYQTQAIGKMHVWPERARCGFDDVILHDGYLHHSRRRERDPRTYDDYLPWLRQQVGESATADYLDNALPCNAMTVRPWDKPEAHHPTSWVVTQAEEWLYRRDPTVPFFLFLSFHRPHAPLDPPAWAFDRYDRAPLAPPVRGDWLDVLEPWRADTNPEANVARYRDDAIHRARAGYYGAITHVDHQIGRFLQILAEFGLADDTVVAFTSDHGEMLGDHDLWRKGYPYEGSARVPLLVSGPGIPRGHRVAGLVELRDVMPTLLSAAGIPVPPSVEGRSILADEPVRSCLHGEHVLLGQSLQWIVADDHKLVWWSGSGREQLFDLAHDPQELHDLAGDPAHAHHADRCRALLVAALEGREEGFVVDGVLRPGAPVAPVLQHRTDPGTAIEATLGR